MLAKKTNYLYVILLTAITSPLFAKQLPVPVQVQITENINKNIETITILNNTKNPIPLNGDKNNPYSSVELDFNYGPSSTAIGNIWGTPWMNWQVSQNGQNYVLTGGTQATPYLQPGQAITILFNTSNDLHASNFTFKAAGGTPIGSGNVAIKLPQAPFTNASPPMVTISGMGIIKQQPVAWNAEWDINDLVPGDYTVSSAELNNGQQFYQANNAPVTVSNNQTATDNISYNVVPTGQVQVTLNNATSSTVNVIFNGKLNNIGQAVHSGQIINLPVDVYQVSAPQQGLAAVVTPNPVTVAPQQTTNVAINYQTANASFIGYWASWGDWDCSRLAQMPSYVGVINIAFGQPELNNQVSNPNLSDPEAFANAVKEVHQKGNKILLSIGGITYATYWQNVTDAKAFAANVKAYLDQYNLDGVDIDYEQPQGYSQQDTQRVIDIIAALRAAMPDKLITTASWSIGAYTKDTHPEWNGNVHLGEAIPILQAVGKDLSWVNVMSYDAGPRPGYDATAAAQAYAQLMPLGAQQVALGIELGNQWGPNGDFKTTVQEAQDYANFVASNNFHGVMLWDLELDHASISGGSSDGIFSQTICKSLGFADCSAFPNIS